MAERKAAALAEIKQLAAQSGHVLSDDEAESILNKYLADLDKWVLEGTSKIKPVGIMKTGKLKVENVIKMSDALSKVYEKTIPLSEWIKVKKGLLDIFLKEKGE